MLIFSICNLQFALLNLQFAIVPVGRAYRFPNAFPAVNLRSCFPASPPIPRWPRPLNQCWPARLRFSPGPRRKARGAMISWPSTPMAIRWSMAPMLDRLPGLARHQQLRRRRRSYSTWARQRSAEIPVGNTPGILDGATADMGFRAAAWPRLAGWSKGTATLAAPEFTRYDPGYMLGREVHGQHARHHRPGADRRASRQAGPRVRHDGAVPQSPPRRSGSRQRWASATQRWTNCLDESDYVMLCCPLTGETTRPDRRGRAGQDEADGHSDQHCPRPGRRYGCADRGPANGTNLRRRSRRDRPRAAAARPSAACRWTTSSSPRTWAARPSKPASGWPKSRSKTCCGAWPASRCSLR